MKELVLYIHGKGGCSGESDHYTCIPARIITRNTQNIDK